MKSLREFLDTIRIEHTLFALPFAYATLFLAAEGWPSTHDLLWITVAMVSGRTVGMAANRVIDAEVDARNPRTAQRAIPAGRLSRTAAIGFTLAALALFIAAVYQLQPICRKLWPVVILAVVAYPYAKRFSAFSHLFLGAVYFLVPTSVWIAVTGTVPPAAVILGVGAALWVAGFDIIYACQDADVDRREGLHSMPANYGLARALSVSQWFHAGFILCLILAGALLNVGAAYWVGAFLTSLLLTYEHRLVRPDDLSKVNEAFFTTNGVVSVGLFVLIALDTVV
jgi:4-hydroxybenzoate polyprenyltransferase